MYAQLVSATKPCLSMHLFPSHTALSQQASISQPYSLVSAGIYFPAIQPSLSRHLFPSHTALSQQASISQPYSLVSAGIYTAIQPDRLHVYRSIYIPAIWQPGLNIAGSTISTLNLPVSRHPPSPVSAEQRLGHNLSSHIPTATFKSIQRSSCS